MNHSTGKLSRNGKVMSTAIRGSYRLITTQLWELLILRLKLIANGQEAGSLRRLNMRKLPPGSAGVGGDDSDIIGFRMAR